MKLAKPLFALKQGASQKRGGWRKRSGPPTFPAGLLAVTVPQERCHAGCATAPGAGLRRAGVIVTAAGEICWAPLWEWGSCRAPNESPGQSHAGQSWGSSAAAACAAMALLETGRLSSLSPQRLINTEHAILMCSCLAAAEMKQNALPQTLPLLGRVCRINFNNLDS